MPPRQTNIGNVVGLGIHLRITTQVIKEVGIGSMEVTARSQSFVSLCLSHTHWPCDCCQLLGFLTSPLFVDCFCKCLSAQLSGNANSAHCILQQRTPPPPCLTWLQPRISLMWYRFKIYADCNVLWTMVSSCHAWLAVVKHMLRNSLPGWALR